MEEQNKINIGEAFCGTWSLCPEKSWHEFGSPARQAVYRIKRDGERFAIGAEWREADGQIVTTMNHFIPDGQEYPHENPEIAHSVSASFPDERTLETNSWKDGEVILFARRQLSEDGRQMTITQNGRTPQGTTFSNISIYEKQPE